MEKKLVDKPKPPFQLYKKVKRKFVGTLTKSGAQMWACGECGTLFAPQWGHGDYKKMASVCCLQKYCECGNKIDGGYTGPKCSPCNAFVRDTTRVAKAEEVETCDGPVYCDSRDRYWSDLDDFMDWLACELDDEEDPSIPEWLHPCETRKLSLCADSLVENALDDHHEDAFDQIDDLKGLQAILDEWAEKQSVESWYPDYDKKINVEKLIAQIRSEQAKDTAAQQVEGSKDG